MWSDKCSEAECESPYL